MQVVAVVVVVHLLATMQVEMVVVDKEDLLLQLMEPEEVLGPAAVVVVVRSIMVPQGERVL